MTTRWALAAGFADMALYLVMVSLPFRALELGASSAALGLIPFLYAFPYATMAWLAGRRSDRVSRVVSVRCGVGGAAVGAVGLALAPTLPWIFALVPILGISLAFHWPALQAMVAENVGPQLAGRVGWFNVGWSGGKSLGFLIGGSLTAGYGGELVCGLAAASFTAVGFLVGRSEEDRTQKIAPAPAPPPTLSDFRRTAWIANGAAFALAATLNHHYPRLLVEAGEGPDRFGQFLGAVFFSQLVSFIVLARTSTAWSYRPNVLTVGLLLLALGTAVVPMVSFRQVLWAAPFLGCALGFFYQSSLYYSVRAPAAKGRNAGIHESVLGIASATIPLLGGLIAASLDHPGVPFWVTGAVLALTGTLAWRWLPRSRIQA